MKIYLGKSDENGDKKLSLFICAYILSSSLNIAVKTIIPISGYTWNIISRSFQGIIILALIVALPVLVYRSNKYLILTEVVFSVLFIFSYSMGLSEHSLLFGTAFWTLAVCIPIGSAGAAVFNKLILYDYLKFCSFVEFPVLCVALLRMKTVESYSMSASYALLLPVLFLFNDFFRKHNYIQLILGLFGTALIIIYGARGPFLCVAVFFLVKLFIGKGNNWIYFTRCLILIGITVLFFKWKNLIQFIQLFLIQNKITSYALQRLINGQIMETSGRDELWTYYIELIKQRPIIGYGLKGGWLSAGNGPHNMLIEFLLAFGVIIGGIICFFSIWLLVKSIKNNEGTVGELVFILACYNFTMYLVSGNWLEKPMFFLFIALALSSRKRPYSNYNYCNSINDFLVD